ncbi:MAG TPA: hypothetical protein VGA98_08940 [Allosphingosinicella sp.]|jgi:hypothetical protein
MSLGKAVLAGLVASIAIPYVLRDHGGQLGDWAGKGVIPLAVAGQELGWSLPLFAGVTVIAWLFMSWSDR